MSLFEDDRYRWRETYFVLFREDRRPDATDVVETLKELGSRYDVQNVNKDEDGRFESLTLLSPYDFAAMDITYLAGEEVLTQVSEVQQDLKSMTLTADDMRKATRLPGCNARFDIYHFEQVVQDTAEDEFLDPGALLIVLERLAEITEGVCIDPQTSSFV